MSDSKARKITSKEADGYEDELLRGLSPSYDASANIRYFVASAVTKDGLELPRVIFIRRRDARRTFCALEWLEQNDDQWVSEIEVDPSSIADVHPSSFRMPTRIVNSITKHVIGSIWFVLTLKDGSEVGYYSWLGNLGQMDFLQLPNGKNPNDVESIRFERPPPLQVMPRAERLDYGPIRLCIYPTLKKGRTIPSDRNEPRPSKGIRMVHGQIQSTINYREKTSHSETSLIKSIQTSLPWTIHVKQSLETELKRLGHLPTMEMSENVRMALRSIPRLEPSWVEAPVKLENGTIIPNYRVTSEENKNEIPASLTLKDGTIIPRAIIIDEKVALEDPSYWKRFVAAGDVASAQPGSFTFPNNILKRLPAETSMSSLEFRVKTRDGSLYACWYSGFNPFIELPPPHQAKDIVEVQAGRQLAQHERAVLMEPDFICCICKEI